MTNCKKEEGFTLMEVLAVIFVITVGITGVFSLIQTTSSSSRLVSYQLTATYLTQEGVELVRTVRDTNWLEDRVGDEAWDKGLEEGDYEFDYTELRHDPDLSPYQEGRYLRLDGEGYNYGTGEKTRFKRKITIEKEDLNNDGKDDKITVKVEVSFDFQGEPYTVNSQEVLFNWK